MNKLFKLTISAVAGAMLLAGCASGTSESVATTESETTFTSDKKLSIVTTTFPEYDWVKNILGDSFDQADVTLLCKGGTDLHSYQPTVDDMMKISESDVFIYNGGESYEWVEDALSSVPSAGMVKVNLLEELGSLAKEEETVEGMQDDEGESEEKGAELDEHVWLSLKNAQYLTDSITEALVVADAENADTYKENALKYKNSLKALDEKYTHTVDSATVKTLLFADRFPFRYLTDDYGLEYFAAFSGCSAETEASFETIAFLSGKVDELSLKHVITIENSDKKIAETVISNTTAKDQDILELNSMQSITDEQINGGLSYISVMEDNLATLEKALN